MRAVVIALVVLLLANRPAEAIITVFLWDDVDDIQAVHRVHDQKDVVAARAKFDAFQHSLLRLKERDLIAVFGKPRGKREKAYAMPIAQPRGVSLSGLRYSDKTKNRDHTEFYIVPEIGGLEVYYQINGESPAAILLYFAVDATFQKLTEDNLAKRLTWDLERFERLKTYTAARLERCFPWEVDQAELAKLESGDYEANAGRKLAAWIESGKALGYTHHLLNNGNDWQWYNSDGKLIRRASRHPGAGGDPVYFEWFRPSGGHLREEWFSHKTGQLYERRWDTRYENSGSWCWYGKNGKVVRTEWDDNRDGIPDWYLTAADQPDHVYDARDKRKILRVEESWAVNPELIPADSKIPDQPGLRVPVRRREAIAKSNVEPPISPEADDIIRMTVGQLDDETPIASQAVSATATTSRTRWVLAIPIALTLLGIATFAYLRGRRSQSRVESSTVATIA